MGQQEEARQTNHGSKLHAEQQVTAAFFHNFLMLFVGMHVACLAFAFFSKLESLIRTELVCSG